MLETVAANTGLSIAHLDRFIGRHKYTNFRKPGIVITAHARSAKRRLVLVNDSLEADDELDACLYSFCPHARIPIWIALSEPIVSLSYVTLRVEDSTKR